MRSSIGEPMTPLQCRSKHCLSSSECCVTRKENGVSTRYNRILLKNKKIFLLFLKTKIFSKLVLCSYGCIDMFPNPR